MAGYVGLLPNSGSPNRAGDHRAQAFLGAHLGTTLPKRQAPGPKRATLLPVCE